MSEEKKPQRPPKKGSIEWVHLPNAPADYEHVELGLRYVGADAKEWALELQRMNLEERGRDADGFTGADLAGILKTVAEQAKEAGVKGLEEVLEAVRQKLSKRASIQYQRDLNALSKKILDESVAGVRGLEGVEETDAEAALDLINFLGEAVEAGTFTAAQAQQNLSMRQRFHSASDRSE